MKILKLKNLYTGGYRIEKVEDNYPIVIGQVMSFKKDVVDKDYKLYRVEEIQKSQSEHSDGRGK